MSNKFKTVTVLDGNGDELTLYEMNDGRWLFGLLVRKRYALSAGERVERRGKHFIVVETGEVLTRV